jgi:hypothetical protein
MRTYLLHLRAVLGAVLLTGILAFSANSAHAQTTTPPPAEPAATAAPQRRTFEGDQTSIGGNYTLRSNETINGGMTIVAGNATLEAGSDIQGDLAVFGGNVTVAGRVKGDLIIAGGNATVADTATITGQMIRIGGNVTVEPGARIERAGSQIEIPAPPVPPALPPPPPLPGQVPVATPDTFSDDQPNIAPQPGGFGDQIRRTIRDIEEDTQINFIDNGAWKVFPGALVITILAMLAASIAPRNIALATETLLREPVLSGGVGALSLIAAPIALAITLVGICLIPVAFAIAIAAGWAVVSGVVGERVMQAFKKTGWLPLTQLLVGSVVLALLGAIPIIGDLVGFAVVALGLGALIATRGGTRAYTRALTTQ